MTGANRVIPVKGEPSAPAETPVRLRVRHGAERGPLTFAIEGTLDEFAARMLASYVASAPHAALTILDLSAAGPIRGKALAVLARLLAGGRRILLRRWRRHHFALLSLRLQLAA